MSFFHKKHIILLFCSLVLALPIVNGLHFVLVDHSINETNKAKFTHHCDDFVQHEVYIYDDNLFEIESPNWIDQNFEIDVFYIFNYQFHLSLELNNKGPPSANSFIA